MVDTGETQLEVGDGRPQEESTANSIDNGPKKRAVRSHSGCLTCRARKVKCDERPGICSNCERLHLECQQPDGTIATSSQRQQSEASQQSGGGLGETGVKRKRTYRSCTQCRSSKARCSGERPECLRCVQRGLHCEYDAEASPQWTRSVRTGSMSGGVNSSNISNLDDRGDADVPVETHSRLFQPPAQMSLPSPRPEIPGRSMQATGRALPPPATPSRASSVFSGGVQDDSDSMNWLFKAQLPSRARVRILVKEYFDNIHPLRCFAFIHRPSFIQRLDESSVEDYGRNALLHIVCALGAKFYALQYSDSLTPLTSKSILSAGNEWAKKAQTLLFGELGNISVQNLMVAVLLHDHELRVGNYASAFMLTGITTRMAQALQVNLEYSTDIFRDEPGTGPSVCSKEARRRLMWSCYIADALVGSGVDQLTLFNEADIKIQLPCNERNFVLQVPCVTEMLDHGEFLKFVPPEAIPPRVVDNMGIVALYIRLVRIRKEALRYVKHLDKMKAPWLPDSEFSAIDSSLRDWYAQLPPSLQFSRAALYTRKESSQLGAFILLQCTYNWTMCDLYRISLPKLYRLRLTWEYPKAYLQQIQETMFLQARRCATILADASRHGIKTLADWFLPAVAFDGNRVMLYYITQILGLNTESGRLVASETLPYIKSNVEVLKSLQSTVGMAEALFPLAADMLNKAGMLSGSRGRESANPPDDAGLGTESRGDTPEQAAPDYQLLSTSVYRMARETILEKHAPENSTASPRSSGVLQSPAASNASYYTTPGHQGAQIPGQVAETQRPHNRQQGQHLPWDPVQPHHSSMYQQNRTSAGQQQPTSHHNPMSDQAVGNVQGGMSDLDAFFTTRFDGTWQPAETASAAYTQGSLPPWIPPAADMMDGTGVGMNELNFDPWPAAADFFGGSGLAH